MRVSSFILTVGFGFAGAGTVMLGVLLPELSRRWGLRDDAAGLLFFLQFLGAAAGAILTGPDRIRSARIGYALLVVSAGTLAVANFQLLFAAFFFFGLGLGMSETATSLIVSERSGDDRPAKLERLNFAWSAGAVAAPLIMAHLLRLPALGPLFLLMLSLFLLLLLWVCLAERGGGSPALLEAAKSAQPVAVGFLLPLAILGMSAVGIESALSGWLTTYSHRAGLEDAAGATLATSLFWAGIVLSRLAASTRLLAIAGRRPLLWGATLGVAASAALLIAASDPVTIRVAAALAGFSLGPLYPLLLSFLLERTARGWYFAIPGIGAVLLPWLTGLLSAHLGSLRWGLVVPAAAAVLTIFVLAASFRPAREPAPICGIEQEEETIV